MPVEYASLVARLPELTPLLIDVRQHLLASTSRVDRVFELLTSAFAELRDVLEDLNAPPSAVERIKGLLADISSGSATSAPAKRTNRERAPRVTKRTRGTAASGSVKDHVREFFDSHTERAYRAQDVCAAVFPEEYRTDPDRVDMLVRKAFSKLYRAEPPELHRFGDGRYQSIKAAKLAAEEKA